MNWIKKAKIKIAKTFIHKDDVTISAEERCLMIIVRKLLNLEDSELYMNIPEVDEIYIKSGDGKVFVCVDYHANFASVINHQFGYDLRISNRVLTYILNIFYAEAKKRRNSMKAEYRNNIRYSLSNVITNLSKTNKDETYSDSEPLADA